MRVRMVIGLNHSGGVMECVVQERGAFSTDEACVQHLSKWVPYPVIIELDLPEPPPAPPIQMVDVQVVKVSEVVQ